MWALRKFEASVNAEVGNPDRDAEHPVLDLAVLRDQNDQRAFGLEPHEFDMLEPLIRLRGEHHAGGAAKSREQTRSFGQHRLDRLRLARGRDLRLDRLAVVLGEIADLHQGVDEEAQPHLGRQPAGRGMRRVDEAELLEIRHDIAHRGRRQGHRQNARQIARADRLAGRQIALDHLAEDFARTLVELGQAQLVGADRNIVGRHGQSPPIPQQLSISGASFQAAPYAR